jgi:REP element-mobilizing transposase RayT
VSEYIHKSHNVTVLIYHLVLPAKYRRVVFDDHVDDVLKEVCLDIEKRYQITFLEIGTDEDHVHFLVQSVDHRLKHCWLSRFGFQVANQMTLSIEMAKCGSRLN